MSESSLILKGVEDEARLSAIEEAERRGVRLGAYLTDVLLRTTLVEQLAPQFEADEIRETAPRDSGRHRLDVFERRISLAVGGLDGAVQGLSERVDEAEDLAAGAADRLEQTLRQAAGELAALHRRVAAAEHESDALGEAQDLMAGAVAERCEGLEWRLDAAEASARAASVAVAELTTAHDQLKYAVADDFSAFARESAARLGAGLEELREAADTAAEQADAALAHIVRELGVVRETIEERLAQGAAETRQRMQTAFADAAERMASLSERVTDCERLTVRSSEQFRAQLADVEDGAQTALEETAETLRQAGAALAAEFARATQDNRGALESVHADLSAEIAELRERQAGGLARLKLVDAAVSNAVGGVAALRETLDIRSADGETAVRALLAQALAEWDGRFDALAARLAGAERAAAESDFALSAGTERVEACVFAALEKLARDRADGDAGLRSELAEVRQIGDGALARLALLDQALGARDLVAGIDAGAAPVDERLAQLEAAVSAQAGELSGRVGRLESEISCRAVDRGFDERLLRLEAGDGAEHALAALRGQIGALAAQVDAQQNDEELAHRLDELRTRLFANETQAGEAADHAHGVARMVGRLTAQQAEATTQADERLHKLELALADMRLDSITSEDGEPEKIEAVRDLEQRVSELEQRQAEALEALRGEIARFVDENLQRLEALEGGGLSAAEHDVAEEFEVLRQRMEERVLGVEQRSVRALEQVADTMAVLEKRFMGAPDLTARSA